MDGVAFALFRDLHKVNGIVGKQPGSPGFLARMRRGDRHGRVQMR
jgi:hypothetical protein